MWRPREAARHNGGGERFQAPAARAASSLPRSRLHPLDQLAEQPDRHLAARGPAREGYGAERGVREGSGRPSAEGSGCSRRRTGRSRERCWSTGFVAGTWKLEQKRRSATLHVEAFNRLSAEERMGVVEEGDRLLAFAAEGAAARDIRGVEELGLPVSVERTRSRGSGDQFGHPPWKIRKNSKAPSTLPVAGALLTTMGLGRFERPTSRLSGGSRGERNTAVCHKNPDRTRDLPTFRFPVAASCPAVWTPIWPPRQTSGPDLDMRYATGRELSGLASA